jgi:hypothetical protein
MLVGVGLRAYLLVDSERLTRPLICVDLLRPLSDRQERRPSRFSPEEAGVFTFDDGESWAVGRLTRDRGWLVVDPALATASPDPPVPFELAAGERLLSDLRGAVLERRPTWYLLDVGRLRMETDAYEPPRGLAVSAIFSHLPPVPRFVDYGSRTELLDRLAMVTRPGGPPTVLVLHGPTGIGKSTIALQLASAVDFGCGWMLNASNASTLRGSLARAHRAEYASFAEALDAAETRALAAAALSRLNGSQAPWVVILDNSDSPPDTPGLLPLMPSPHESGQLLIITTTDQRWLGYAAGQGWVCAHIPPLTPRDLANREIPARLGPLVGGLPLVVEILNALGSSDKEDSIYNASSGSHLAWYLLLGYQPGPDVIRLARTMAWCPSDPVSLRTVGKIAGPGADRAAAEVLAHAQFVSFTEATGSLTIQMHHLIAEAIREQTWDDEPTTAVQVTQGLVLTDTGRILLAEAADGSALARLEEEAHRVQELLPTEDDRGRFMHGLGTARGNRGPVSASAPFWLGAVKLLNRDAWPYETAESLIGLARVVFQSPAFEGDLRATLVYLEEADELLVARSDSASRQLRSKGDALSTLIGRKLLRYAPDRKTRLAQLLGLLEEAWGSYEQRVRIVVGLPDGALVDREPPRREWGESTDHAYYNLAGFYLDLAKESPEDLGEARRFLETADEIYVHCRALREDRYSGVTHPALASCIHGSAIVAYYQAVILHGDQDRIVDAISRANAALAIRSNLASAFAGSDQAAVLRDSDVRKSMDLLLKASAVASALSGQGHNDPTAGAGRLVREAFEELGISE